MADVATQVVEPHAAPVPPKPTTDPLTPSQWRTLLAIADAVIPSVEPRGSASTNASAKAAKLTVSDSAYTSAVNSLRDQTAGGRSRAEQYLAEKPSEVPAFRESLWRFLGTSLPADAKNQLTAVFNVLDTRAGALVLTGYLTPLADQPVETIQAILKSWTSARLPVLRMLAKSLTVIVKRNWITESPTIGDVLEFPRVPTNYAATQSYPYEFLQFRGIESVETDVVVVGSGCGAGVVAKNVAEAGFRVIVTEQKYHWNASHFPMTQSEAVTHLFMNSASIVSDQQNVAIAAGSAFGGGGTINWSASLQTQGYVRREWSQQHNLPFFTSAEFQNSLDRVCERMGVSADHIEHNKTNRVLLEGARKLGWTHKPVPQNTGGTKHYCGYCHLGCGGAEKQGPMISFLRDAAEKGAKFVEGFDVREVVWEKKNGQQVAVGVKGIWTSRDGNGGLEGSDRVTKEVIIRAKKVVISAGTMQSPLILKRSGLKNSNIGKNLRIHPVSFLGAVFPEETKPWEGGILTGVVNEFEDMDGKGHGAKLEATSMLPSSFLTFLPWRGGLEYKLDAAKLKNMTGYISLARDVGAGQVYPDSGDGRVRFQYNPTTQDRKHIIEGLIGLAKIVYVEGATEIFTVIPSLQPFKRTLPLDGANPKGINDPAFHAWCESIRKTGLNDADNMIVSAHQMGTCKMGSSASKSVVDPDGKVWGTENLYVADASVFPSASGVNPMITNMAISDWTSRGIVEELKGGVGSSRTVASQRQSRL